MHTEQPQRENLVLLARIVVIIAGLLVLAASFMPDWAREVVFTVQNIPTVKPERLSLFLGKTVRVCGGVQNVGTFDAAPKKPRLSWRIPEGVNDNGTYTFANIPDTPTNRKLVGNAERMCVVGPVRVDSSGAPYATWIIVDGQ